MKNRNYLQLLIAMCLVTFSLNSAFGQSYCDAAGNAQASNSLLPWKLRPETKSGNWGTAMKPVFQEMQRVFPQPPKGLELTYGVFDAMNLSIATPKDIQYFEAFFMIKDIVCQRIKGKNEFGPESVTGNWMYFRVNDFNGFAVNANSGDLVLAGTGLPLKMSGDIRIEENKNGMKSVYFFDENNQQTFKSWYFSEIKALPYRRITKLEFAQSYRQYWLNKIDIEIARLEGVLETSKKTFTRVSAEKGTMTEAEKQKLFQSLREGDQKTQQYIDQYKTKRETTIRVTEKILKSPDSQSEAFIINFNEILNQPTDIRFGSGKGKYVYAANQNFYDPKLPKWQPQLITVELRKEGDSPAKIAFSKKVEDEFNFNVIRKLVGMKPLSISPSITKMGDTPDGTTSGKIENNKANEASGELFADDFANSTIGQAPPKWIVSNNTGIVKKNAGAEGNWLAMKKEGLFFPDYSVLLLPTNFTMEFDVSWTKDISYYSPSFYFHIGAAPYDNTLKRYDRQLVNTNAYTSARMERVALWIDPHWNNEQSQFGLQVFDNRGGYVMDKSDKTKMFFRNKNRVKIKLVRKGSFLTVYFNGTKMMEEAVMGENVRWNFFGFGVNNAPNAEQGDEFYLSNIRLTKE